jgi:hypothetical protein
MLSHKEPTVVESLFQQMGEYAETRGALLKLTAVDKASELISLAAVRAAVFLIASVTILLLSIATAFLLGEWLGRYSYGFFIVTIAFALAGILVSLRSARWVKDPVARLVITKVLGEGRDAEHNIG